VSTSNQTDGPVDDVRVKAVQHLREKMTAGELARNLADRLSDEQLAKVANGDLGFLNRQPDAADVEADSVIVPAESVDQTNRGSSERNMSSEKFGES